MNEWNESRREQELAALYTKGILEELQLNKTELEQKLLYHKELLQNLTEDPINTKLVLRPPSLHNSAWKLSENDIFKRYIDPGLYGRLIEIYQIHEKLMIHSEESSSMMSELNVLGPLYTIGALGQTISDEDTLEFNKSIKQGWIPIFQDWIYFEQLYIEKIEEVLSSL